MSRFLFATFDGGGNLPPVLGIGSALVAAGHSVQVIGHPGQRRAVESAALPFTPYSTARPWSPLDTTSTLRGLIDLVGVFNDRGAGRDVVELARRMGADAVAADCLLLGVLATAQAAGLQTVTLFHSFHAYFDKPWRRGPAGMLSTMRGHRAGHVWSSSDRSLVLSQRALDPDAGRGRPGLVWTGAVVDGIPAVRQDAPKVLVSLSTIAYPGMARTLQRIVDSLASLEAEVVVTTGPAIDPASVQAPANTTVHRYLDHADVMRTCSAVVGHGGHATTLRALAHDLPILVIPAHPMLDQKMVGHAVARAGAGSVLARNATADQIRRAVETLLRSPEHRAAAALLGSEIRTSHGAQAAADELAAVAS